MGEKLNWGILATGLIARKFATDLARSNTGRLVAVGSRTREAAGKFAAEFGGVRAHGSYEALLADREVQAVYIATPHPQHLEWMVRAAEAGKQILCEKPLALNRGDAEQMIATARRHKVLLMEAFMYRCHPQTVRLVELVRGGAIGELRAIRASFNFARPFDPKHRLYDRALGGGAIVDVGCYPVSFSRLMAGAAAGKPFAEPVEFKATGRLHPVGQIDEYAAAAVKYPGDVIAELSCGITVREEIGAQLHGTQGWIEVPTPFFPGLDGCATAFRIHRPGAAVEEVRFEDGKPLYAHEADTFAAAVFSGALEVPAMSHADTLGNLAVLDAWRAQVGVRYPGE